MVAGAGSELAASGGITLNRRRHLLEAKTEHIVQQEGRAFERGEAFQRQSKHRRA
jgi:hypothetical protein